jgi:hypothetical protein
MSITDLQNHFDGAMDSIGRKLGTCEWVTRWAEKYSGEDIENVEYFGVFLLMTFALFNLAIHPRWPNVLALIFSIPFIARGFRIFATPYNQQTLDRTSAWAWAIGSTLQIVWLEIFLRSLQLHIFRLVIGRFNALKTDFQFWQSVLGVTFKPPPLEFCPTIQPNAPAL